MDIQISNVYIMQASNGLIKIGKANNVEIRRLQLEQNANMFNEGERVTLKVAKVYPCITDVYAFAMEAGLHEHFAEYQAGTSSREVFRIELSEVLKIADTWHRAFTVAQSIKYHEVMFKSKIKA